MTNILVTEREIEALDHIKGVCLTQPNGPPCNAQLILVSVIEGGLHLNAFLNIPY